MIELEEAKKLPANTPVRLKENRYGVLCIYPEDDGICGIQIPGEQEHRWVNCKNLLRIGDILLEY